MARNDQPTITTSKCQAKASCCLYLLGIFRYQFTQFSFVCSDHFLYCVRTVILENFESWHGLNTTLGRSFFTFININLQKNVENLEIPKFDKIDILKLFLATQKIHPNWAGHLPRTKKCYLLQFRSVVSLIGSLVTQGKS